MTLTPAAADVQRWSATGRRLVRCAMHLFVTLVRYTFCYLFFVRNCCRAV